MQVGSHREFLLLRAKSVLFWADRCGGMAAVVQALSPESSALAANAIRALAIDAVNAAKSGHPGAPMGLADLATVLFAEVLRYDVSDPHWPDRDRFVLSNGHASMLLYACLHLAGYDLSMDEIRRFRQLHSKTPGHPEYGMTPGVETTTGPLGQGFANAVGMALARRLMAERLPPRDGFGPISHYVYCIAGDGCMMEGISSEAASMAGHLGLGELIVFYDDNGISIDGDTGLAFTEDVEMRFTAHGWHTLRIDGHNVEQIRGAVRAAQEEKERPTLVLARTRIGYGSPNREGTAKAHGEALGEEEGRLAKEKLGWTHAPFEIPDEVYAAFRPAAEAGKAVHAAWKQKLDAWRSADAGHEQAWRQHFEGPLTLDTQKLLDAVSESKGAATRNLSGQVMNALAAQTPRFLGGSADLTGSTKNKLKDMGTVNRNEFSGRNLHYGVREHGMAAAVNGMALYGGLIPFGATFLTFSDYMKNSVRLSALMKVRAIQIFTHDSIGLGEDGPTHQPIEHLWSLRLIPGLDVWRPADGVETAMSWAYAVCQGGEAPHALVFSRQGSKSPDRPAAFTPQDVWKGAYVVSAPAGERAVLIGTGTELGLAVETAEVLAGRGIPVRVVSMPCVERFLAQDEATQASILPANLPRASVEAGSTLGWKAIVGSSGICFGVDTFGESAPAPEVYRHFKLDPQSMADRMAAWLS